MLWFVRIALKRPYTFVVLALLILIFGPLAALRSPTDIFPDIKIPVISAVWTYSGLSPEDMSGRVVYYYERQLSSTVNDIDHIESQSLAGYGIVKIFFQPNVDIRTATAQVTSISQTVLKQMPPGITPPLILNYNASTVPILQLALSSIQETEQKLFDFGQNFIRPQLATVPGTTIPSPYGGKVRQIQIDVNQEALQAKRLSAEDVENALAAQNQIIPVGTQKIGKFEYSVKLNNSPDAFEKLSDLPIKAVDGTIIYMRDIASIRDGNPPQTNIVRVNGSRAVLMTVLKSGAASTLDIVSNVKKLLPTIEETLPKSVHINAIGDQSIFVKAAVSGVAREAVIAALLTSLMILLFLGSWRSTLIITASIPLAILSSIAALYAMGETLNIMTLGGLALAVGILVDDATVTIENINWHLEQGKEVRTAIMDGAHQIVGPAFVSLLCICIVFIPMFFLSGVAHYLFVPMAEAVMFAMIASFILSRTLVPTMAAYLLRMHSIDGHPSGELLQMMQPNHITPSHSKNPLVRFQQAFERLFIRIRDVYYDFLRLAMENQRKFVIGFLSIVLLSFALVPWLGRDFFPAVDSGQIKLHVRAQIGTRIEETAKLFDQVEQQIRTTIPKEELGSIVDNIGLTVSGINQVYNNTGTIGPQDGDILISLNEGHAPTDDYVTKLRKQLSQQFPGTTFSFLPADIISQILNFGAPAPIDVQVMGPNGEANMAYAQKLLREISNISGIADTRIQQANNYPQLLVDVDRTRAKQMGITERDVTNSLVVTMAGSGQVAPAFWLNKRNGVSYPVVAQTPEYRIQTLSDLQNIPIAGDNVKGPQILGGLATITRSSTAAVVSHYAVQPAIDIFATPQHRDLGGVASDIERILKANEKDRPKGSTISLRGQVQTMNTAFSGLLFGLLAAVVLIYLLIVVNFQSWSDPFVIITALPAALAGIVWMLFATHTTLSVPALTGAIMCMGVATANSILVISFARERLQHTGNSTKAALEAGFTRFRPVVMTALAMIIGMAPMALGLGEGGEQNAPLGRAVIGGLMAATVATLFFVPIVFSMVHRHYQHTQSNENTSDGETNEF
ncbi:efflux RND transporter permease subunit [Solimicrobium silvestre]|uniref:Cation/multidrug efflux pump n=1 Tax=Solimicrobium silvestre TaxID=2099400 RepID=A0A2S9H132_9BURK|nr:efflux RND transporter permease subunit [Solimicrobium silvestre]PRC93653.1 Cation/multidrug efflux pump [Solimicrobium silvestre]